MSEEIRCKEISFTSITSRKILLMVQASLCFGLAFIMLWITTIRPMVSFDTEEISPLLFDILRFGVSALLLLWGGFYLMKAIRYKIILEDQQMIVQRIFASTSIPYSSIATFLWRKDMVRFAGIIPFIHVKLCTIIGNTHAPLVVLSSLDYKHLEKKMQALEAQLTNEPIL